MDLVGQLIALLGALVFLTAGIGIFRYRDVYGRMSAVATASGVGIVLVTIGVLLVNFEPGNIVKGIVAIILQLMTASIASIIIARSAINSDHPFSDDTDTEEMKPRRG